ncbi:ImmA/IrrE family metallo-endopeptidase [Sporosalibacterium faouarense]|uniref:ImmA/IrrE family metallo-endopeptidase n=1 Tax=Sporosalibacterium faouarense TaxID=516123 RepID=UPI00192CCC77|nr:ImmA/IrrE family metallo-endopeptidase [Sporosalibacterium faouarense]
MIDSFNFKPYFDTPETLANKFLDVYFNDTQPSYPINPFMILEDLNIVFQFRDFKELEGIYIVPEDEDDIPVVGINNKRPISRQRFTAAHEICHHIKDRNVARICPIGKKDEIEKFADKFASELLMPKFELEAQAIKFEKNGYVEFEDVIIISDYFGVSFESCVFALAYKLRKIDGDIRASELKKRIRKFKPVKKRKKLGLKNYDINLLKNVIESYTYFLDTRSPAVWYKFKNNFVYNENKLEGVNIDYPDIAEIVTDLRVNNTQSDYCTSEYKDIIEVVGHASLYDYLINTEENISVYKILKLHKLLYQYAPYSEYGGSTRKTNNYVSSSKFETVDFNEIGNRMFELDQELNQLIKNKDEISLCDYIEMCVMIHYKITIIHPFHDGNGRVSRAMLNWLLKLKNLPPIYLRADKKERYYDALMTADTTNDYDPLYEVFYRAILSSLVELNTKFEL